MVLPHIQKMTIKCRTLCDLPIVIPNVVPCSVTLPSTHGVGMLKEAIPVFIICRITEKEMVKADMVAIRPAL